MYKVGDKVRVNERGHAYFAGGHRLGDVFPVGTTGVVVDAGDADLLLVKFDVAAKHQTNGGGNGWWMKVCQIEPISDKPKFSEGDKVRVYQPSTELQRDGIIFKGAGVCDCIRYCDGKTDGFDRMDCVRFIKVVHEEKPKYAVGDSVRVYQHCNYMEREGTIFIGDSDDECIRYHDGLHGNGWDFMVNVRFIENITRMPRADRVALTALTTLVEATPVASTATPQEEGVVRSVGATVAGLSFSHSQGEVTVFDEDGDCVGAMTLAHFNEVARILNEEAK